MYRRWWEFSALESCGRSWRADTVCERNFVGPALQRRPVAWGSLRELQRCASLVALCASASEKWTTVRRVRDARACVPVRGELSRERASERTGRLRRRCAPRRDRKPSWGPPPASQKSNTLLVASSLLHSPFTQQVSYLFLVEYLKSTNDGQRAAAPSS